VAIPPLVLRIIADSTGMKGGVAEAQGSLLGLKGTAGGTSAALTAGLAVAGVAAVKFGVDSVKAFSEAQQVMAQTEAVLRSTGGAANVSADDVLNLASKYQNLTGIQDDAIQSSENLLLTFTAVHNEAGRGNDIFNQATAAILDMSTALNRGAVPSADQLQASTIQLGKALNDPIAGMTALKRVGVSFDQSQIATIKHLQESGDLMGAQKIILAELRKEFGGAAKAAGDTFAGQLAKLQANVNNLQERIGGVLVPALLDLSSVLNDLAQAKLPAASEAIRAFGVLVPQAGGAAVAATEDLGESSGKLVTTLGNMKLEAEATQAEILNWAHAIDDGSLTVEKLRANLDQMGGSADAVDDVINDVRGTLVGWSKTADDAADAASGFAHMSETAFADWRKESIDDLNGVKGSLDDLAKRADLTAGAILRAFDKQIQAMEDYQQNWQTLLRRGLPDSLAQQLQEMGLEGANIVAALAEANNRKFNAIIDDWQKAQREAAETANAVDRIGSAVRSLPSSATISVKTIFTREGNFPSGQHGGVVTQTGLAVIHKGEAISGVNNEMGFGGGGDIVLQIDGQEFFRITRDGLHRLGRRNVTAGIP
jgi:hypothetical protein